MAKHRLVDWRKLNEEQYRTGICATLGEDGEPLAVFDGELRAEHVVEDDYEETLGCGPS